MTPNTAKAVYRRFQSAAARKRMQPFFRMLRSVAAAGMNYQPGHYSSSGELEILRLIAATGTPVQTIFDVGANIGGWSLAAAEVFPEATIYAFEPAAETFGELERAVKGTRIVPVNAALSDVAGKRDLFSVPGMSWMSSLESLDLSRVKGVTASRHETVQCLTADGYCSDHGIGSVDIMKIDTEGHELSVLHGAADLIERHLLGYVQFEVGAANLDTKTYLRDFVRTLDGYRVCRVLRDGLSPVRYTVKEELFFEANFYAVEPDRPIP